MFASRVVEVSLELMVDEAGHTESIWSFRVHDRFSSGLRQYWLCFTPDGVSGATPNPLFPDADRP